MEQTDQADWILPPTIGNIHVVTTSTAAAALDISLLADRGTYLSIMADGAKCYVTFASTSATADDLDTTTTSTPASPAATTCVPIPDGSVMNVKLDGGGNHDFLGYRTSTGSGYLRMWISGPPRKSSGYSR